jgi:micrococcal nuclease
MSLLRLWFLCLVSLVVLTIVIGVTIQTIPQEPKRLLKKDSVQLISEASISAYPPENSGELFRVKRVVDGDTIQLENGDKVRYIGVNTPETVDPRRPVQCFGKEAKEKNRELVEGKLVRLVKDISETDRYGRKLRYVYAGEVFINSELIKYGYATTETLPPDVHFSNFFRDLEATAREQKIGLWQSCRK